MNAGLACIRLRGRAMHAVLLGVLTSACGYNPTYSNTECADRPPACPSGFVCDTSRVPRVCVKAVGDGATGDPNDGQSGADGNVAGGGGGKSPTIGTGGTGGGPIVGSGGA